MTKDELHDIYRWAMDCALRMFAHDDNIIVAGQAELFANARIAWVNAKAKELSA